MNGGAPSRTRDVLEAAVLWRPAATVSKCLRGVGTRKAPLRTHWTAQYVARRRPRRPKPTQSPRRATCHAKARSPDKLFGALEGAGALQPPQSPSRNGAETLLAWPRPASFSQGVCDHPRRRLQTAAARPKRGRARRKRRPLPSQKQSCCGPWPAISKPASCCRHARRCRSRLARPRKGASPCSWSGGKAPQGDFCWNASRRRWQKTDLPRSAHCHRQPLGQLIRRCLAKERAERGSIRCNALDGPHPRAHNMEQPSSRMVRKAMQPL